MNQSVSSRVHADLALAVYFEPLAEDRRVLLLGEADGTLALRLERVVGRLDIIDPAAREPSRGEVPELPFRDASFDLVIVADITSLPDPRPDAVRELRRVLAEDGVLALCNRPNGRGRRRAGAPAAVLEKLLSSEFQFVRVLGESPLVGYSLGEVDSSRDEEFSVDSSLVRGQRDEAERFIGVGSDARLRLESRLWVQVPQADSEGQGEAEAAPDLGLVDALRRAEEDAREALRRESDLLRELETERRGRAEAQQVADRAKLLERNLLAAEADYDDAVARVRFLESELAEREAAVGHDRERQEKAHRELAQAKAEATAAQAKVAAVEAERDAARAEIEAGAKEAAELERRLVEVGQQVLELERDKKRHQVAALDLLEELRRLEHDKSAAVEHDARVAELEAERERAVSRALEAEVAREAAQMRVDELRAQLGQVPVRGVLDAEIEGTLLGMRLRLLELEQELRAPAAKLEALRGENTGLSLRLDEAESALRAATSQAIAPAHGSAEVDALERQLADTQEVLSALERQLADANAALRVLESASAAQPADQADSRERERDAARIEQLEASLDDADRRIRELGRELEEADRFAEAHAEDADRVEALEVELDAARRRLDAVEDDLRSTQDELRGVRSDAEAASIEASARIELAQRRESEARSERDDARAALEEGRGILAQLAGRVGADANDPPSIVQAIDRTAQPHEVDGLRGALAAAAADRSDRERLLEQMTRELEGRDERIRQLERNLQASIRASQPPPPVQRGPESPETD